MMTRNGRGLRPLPRALAAGVLLTLPLAACDIDSLLDIDDPAVATPGSLADPNALPLLIAGAIGDFQLAWNGGGGRDTFTPVTGLFSDELHDSDTFTTRIANDQRAIEYLSNNTDLIFRDLQRARISAQNGSETVTAVRGANDPDAALLLAYEGYSIIGLGEAFCSNVPLSDVVDGEFVSGPGLSTSQLMDEAIAKFDAGLAMSPPADVANLLRVGKARAQLNNNQPAAAAATVAAVPTSFEWIITYSETSTRQENDTWVLNWSNERYSMSNNEGINGLPFRTVLGSTDLGLGFDNETPLWGNPVHTDRGSDLVLASGTEARLIQAEAALRAGDFPAVIAFLDPISTRVGAGDVIADANAGRDLVFRERAYEMYLTGHRMGDLRRLVRQYSLPVASVFPTGNYHKLGLVYGNQASWFVPFQEENNPEYDPAACNVNAA